MTMLSEMCLQCCVSSCRSHGQSRCTFLDTAWCVMERAHTGCVWWIEVILDLNYVVQSSALAIVCTAVLPGFPGGCLHMHTHLIIFEQPWCKTNTHYNALRVA